MPKSSAATLNHVLITGIVGALLLPIAESRADPTAVPDGQHDFDFAFGRWKTHISRLVHPLTGSSDWVDYDGIHVIHQVWSGRANLGELEVDGPAGHIEAMSPRLYDPDSRQWSIYYGSPRDGSLSKPVIGAFLPDGHGEFYGETTVNGRVVLVRELYAPVNPTTRRLDIAYSPDGGKTWETNWKMTDTKLKETPKP